MGDHEASVSYSLFFSLLYMKQTAAESIWILKEINYSIEDKLESHQMPQYC